MEISRLKNRNYFFLGSLILWILTIPFVSQLGAVSIQWEKILEEGTSMDKELFYSIRLPRVLLAMILGGSLAWSGAIIQGIFRNPIVEPGLVGITAGSSLFAAIGIVFGANFEQFPPIWGVIVFSFVGGILMGFLILSISKLGGKSDIYSLLLTGIAINALCFSAIGFLSYIANDAQLRALSFWNLGSVGGASWEILKRLGIFLVLPLFVGPFLSKQMNLLSLGEREAMHLGVRVEYLKNLSILLVGVNVGAAISISGSISFVGLIVPHIVRILIGQDYKYLLPISYFLGGVLLSISDGICRIVVPPTEIPVGVITALLGAPFFIVLLNQRRSVNV